MLKIPSTPDSVAFYSSAGSACLARDCHLVRTSAR